MNREKLEALQNEFKSKSSEEVIASVLALFGPENIALASSFSLEDQVVTDMILRQNPKGRIFTLDTGRMFQESYDVMEETAERYGVTIEVCFPETTDIVDLLERSGPNSFYKSVENRKECCHLRKVKPLKKKLSTLTAWMTGLRAQQSVTRDELNVIQWDETFSLIKVNPIVRWSEEELWSYVKERKIPYNRLHDQSYPSIGCLPCTRPVNPGEDVRAGRWWWEQPEHKECGLHIVNGKLVRGESDGSSGQA